MSSFSIGAATVSFTADRESFRESLNGPVRELQLQLYLDAPADWSALVSLRSWSVTVRPIPGGANAYVDVAGGAGPGTLVLDNVVGSPFTAVLSRLDRDAAYPGGGRLCRATFQAW